MWDSTFTLRCLQVPVKVRSLGGNAFLVLNGHKLWSAYTTSTYTRKNQIDNKNSWLGCTHVEKNAIMSITYITWYYILDLRPLASLSMFIWHSLLPHATCGQNNAMRHKNVNIFMKNNSMNIIKSYGISLTW